MKITDIECFQYSNYKIVHAIQYNNPQNKNCPLIFADNIQSMHNNDQNQLIQQIYKYLNDNFSQPIGLTNVSEHVNRNPSYISRFIKQATGRKFSEILAELRLEEAKKLLRSSNLKITQIAEQVGYPNLQYFTRVFTGQMNMTPAEYRKITTYF